MLAKEAIDLFKSYLIAEQGLASNTVLAYIKDVEDFILFEYGSIDSVLREVYNFNKYVEDLNLRGIKKSSFLRKISSLSKFFGFLISEGLLSKDPVSGFKRPRAQRRIPKCLTLEEIKLLFDNIANKKPLPIAIRDELLLSLLCDSGLRVSELASLKVNAVNVSLQNTNADGGCFILIKGKGNKERLVPIKKCSVELLLKYLPTRRPSTSVFLFPSLSLTGHITREQIGIILKQASMLAGLDITKVSPHVLRHSFATQLYANQIDLRTLQELLGHASISTTEIYIHTKQEEIADFVNTTHPFAKNIFGKNIHKNKSIYNIYKKPA